MQVRHGGGRIGVNANNTWMVLLFRPISEGGIGQPKNFLTEIPILLLFGRELSIP